MSSLASPRVRLYVIIGFGVATFGLVFPTVRTVVQARQRIAELEHEAPRALLASALQRGQLDPGFDRDIMHRMIAILGGDAPGRLGDLEFGSPIELAGGRIIPFSVQGETSFAAAMERLAQLEAMRPVVSVTSIAMKKDPEHPHLTIMLQGRIELLGSVIDSAAVADARLGGRDPFAFSSGAAPVFREPATPGRAPAMPAFQGTGSLDGIPVAFFGGRAYRIGDKVGNHRLVAIEDGEARLARAGEDR